MGYELIFHLPYKACLHFIMITVQECTGIRLHVVFRFFVCRKVYKKGRRIKDFCFFLLILVDAIRKYALFLNMSIREENKEIMIRDTGLS